MVVSGSVRLMMVRIFEDPREQLSGRSTRKLDVGPFHMSVLIFFLKEHRLSYEHMDLLALYILTGGVPQYIEVLIDAGAVTRRNMLRFALSSGSVFLREGD